MNDAAPSGRSTPAPRAPTGARLAPLAALALLLALGVALRFAFLDVPRRTPDERLYAAFGARVASEGPGAIASLVREFVADPTRPYPWPTRAGFVLLAGGAMRATGDDSPATLAWLSALSSALSLLLVAWLAWRLLGPWPAAIAVSLLAASPLELALARRAWQDSPLELVVLAMAACWILAAERPGRRAAAAAFLALGALALTIKESAAIPFALGASGLASVTWRDTRRAASPAAVLLGALAAAACAGALVVAASGGFAPLARTLELGRAVNAPNDYMREFQTGPPAYYFTGLALVQPLALALGGVAAALAALGAPFLLAPLERPGAKRAIVALGWFVLAFGAVACAWPQKNLRFLSPLFPPAAVLGGALVAAGLAALRARAPERAFRLAAGLLALALVAALALDAARFHHYFVALRIPDLATPWFTRAAALGK